MAHIPGVGNLDMPDLSDYTPALIPEPARPLVLAPILLVKSFARVVVWVVIAVLAILGVIFCTIPAQISTFGIVNEILSTVICALVIAAMIYMVLIKGMEIVGWLDLLEDFSAGEVTAAIEVTRLIAVKSAGVTGDAARAVADGVMNFKPGEAVVNGAGAVTVAAGTAANATGDAAMAAGAAVGDGAKQTAAFAGNVVGGTFNMLKDPRAAAMQAAHSVGDAASTAAQAGSSAIASTVDATGKAINYTVDATGNAMNTVLAMNPLAAFEKVIKMVLEVCWYLVVLTPPVLILAGWVVWKIGIRLSGLELIAFGVGFAVLGGMGWWAVNVTAKKQLDHAGVQIIRIQIENMGSAMGLGEGLEGGNSDTDVNCVSVRIPDCDSVSTLCSDAQVPSPRQPLLTQDNR